MDVPKDAGMPNTKQEVSNIIFGVKYNKLGCRIIMWGAGVLCGEQKYCEGKLCVMPNNSVWDAQLLCA